jgi:hypothetical protein
LLKCLLEDDYTVEDDQMVEDHRDEKITSDELDRILNEVNTVEDKHIVGDCNIFEDDHIVGDNILAKDDLSDNCNESKDKDHLSNKSEVNICNLQFAQFFLPLFHLHFYPFNIFSK